MERKVTLECYAAFSKFKDGHYPAYKRKPDTEDGYWLLWSRFNMQTSFNTKEAAMHVINDWKNDGITEYKVVHQVQEITETDILFGNVENNKDLWKALDAECETENLG